MKRAAKARMVALFAERRRLGQNKKSKRFLARERRVGVRAIKHRLGPCGNFGCDTCRGRRPCGRLTTSCGCGGRHEQKG